MGNGMTRRRFLAIGATAVGTVAAGGGLATAAVHAPEAPMKSYTMGDGAMKALVVYESMYGNTAAVGEAIAGMDPASQEKTMDGLDPATRSRIRAVSPAVEGPDE